MASDAAEPSDEALIPKTTYGDQCDIRSDIAEAKEHVSAVDEENHRLKQRIAELEREQNIFQNAAGKAAVRAEGLEDLYEKSQARVARLTEALGLVLPLAKGYVTNHDYASSREYIAVAESVLAEANDAG